MEPYHEKTCLRCCRPGATHTRLINYIIGSRIQIEDADQLDGYCAAALHFLPMHMQKSGFLMTRLRCQKLECRVYNFQIICKGCSTCIPIASFIYKIYDIFICIKSLAVHHMYMIGN